MLAEDVEQLSISNTSSGNTKGYNHFGKQFGRFFQIKHGLAIQPSNPTCRYLPNKKNEHIHGTQMIIAILFIISINWK